MIAMATACGPDLLIADETHHRAPMSRAGADLDIMREFAKELNTSVVLISQTWA